MRDRLIKLIAEVQYMGGLEEKLADHLINNGVLAVDFGVVSPRNRPLISQCFGRPLDEVLDLIRTKQEWISVEDRLPEDVYDKDRKIITVLVCTKSGRVSTSSRVRMMRANKEKMAFEYTDIFEWSGQIAKKVTHWMPLPEPPKKGGAE